MKLARSDVEYQLNNLQGMVYAACRMGAWCFNDKKQLFYSTAPHQQEYHMLLQTGGCLDAALEKKDLEGVPCVLSGDLGLGWIAEWVHLRQGGRLLVILGPMYLKNSSIEESLERLDRRGLSQHLRRDYMRVLGDVPFVHSDSIKNFASMLHFTCYEENMSRDSILFESIVPLMNEKPEEEIQAPENDFARQVAYEEMLLRCLGEGRAPSGSGNNYGGEVQDFHLKDSLRQLKDNLIVFNALCARTAIRRGVSLTAAKTRESGWIRKVEELRSFGAASRVVQGMYRDYQHLIRQVLEADGMSKAIRDARDYIRMNYTRSLSTGDIARHCGYTEYYLTRKFTRETGVKLTDYIRSVRLEAAKVMLLTSQKDIQQISEELQFGSRSYFDRVFRQEIGMSPKRFRETRGQDSEKEKS
ncbi:MAG: helix-turn-helix transcriptional regulator [Lachnospiraceae bacterium]|nr:helix-turn-helix transcriptional regulator [Lachnospiraceae bacterium]